MYGSWISHALGYWYFNSTVRMVREFYLRSCRIAVSRCVCTKYKSLTAIPDLKNADILFIYGAMTCYEKG